MGAAESNRVEEIRQVIESNRFRFTTERELQDQLSAAFTAAGIQYDREVELAPGDIIDFMVPRYALIGAGGGLGLEVKTKGSLAEVTRQLHRYSGSNLVHELLLVTTKPQLGNQPSIMQGKPQHLITIYGGIL